MTTVERGTEVQTYIKEARDWFPASSGFVEPNFFELEGEGFRVTYRILRARREFLDYEDSERKLSFGGGEEEIDSSRVKSASFAQRRAFLTLRAIRPRNTG